jgi:uncharacterized surface protein with fasciclin (FAS1) repeats
MHMHAAVNCSCRSVLGALLDPASQLQTFASLVQRAGLTGLIDSSGDAFTLFAPNEQVRADSLDGSGRAAEHLQQPCDM